MSRRPIVPNIGRKLLPTLLFLAFVVGGIMPIVLLTVNLNASGTAPEPRPATFTPNFLFNITDSEFNVMNGIAINPTTGKVYITNVNGGDAKVLVFNQCGIRLSQIGSTTGTADGQFDTPMGIAVDQSGRIFVADSANDRVQVFDSNGAFLFKFGSNAYTDGNFLGPTSVAVNGTGYIYVSETGGGGAQDPRVQVFDPSGNFVDSWVFNSNANPANLAINSTGHVYVVRSTADNVQVYTCYGALLYTITNAGFNTLKGAAINSSGHLHIADAGTADRVHACNKAGNYLYYLGGTAGTQPGQMSNPSAVAINPLTDHLIELDDGNNRVQIYGAATSMCCSFIVNNGNATTTTRSVTLAIGALYATEMCFSNDSTTWTAWEPLASTKAWMLTDGNGLKTVYIKLRGNGETTPVSTTITLDTTGGTSGDIPPEFTTGFLIVEYITFGVLFGAFAVIEVVLPKLKKRREGPTRREEPTRLKAVNKTPDKR